MTDHQCQCGAPAPDTTLCRDCTGKLRSTLGSLYRRDRQGRDVTSLGDDLDIALSRQARFSDRADGSRSTTTPLLFAYAASEAGWVVRNTLAGWVRDLADDDTELPPSTLEAMAEWLHDRVDVLARHDAGDDAYREITSAVGNVRAAVDRPPELVYAGPCLVIDDDGEECRADVYARPGRPYAVCKRCGASHDLAERRAEMAAQVEDRTVTATRAAVYMRMLGFDVTASAIRGYAHRGALVAVDHTVRGAVYRLGDILDIVTRTRREAAS